MIKLYLTKKVKKERELKIQALEENKILKAKLKDYYKFIKSIAAEERPIGHIGRLSSRIVLDRIIKQARKIKDEEIKEIGKML